MKKEVIFLLIFLFISSCAQKEAEEMSVTSETLEEPVVETPEETTPEEPETLLGALEPEAEEPETYDAVTQATPVSPNLIAHWKFEGNAKDSINDHDGTIFGDAIFDTGKKGKAISFDGVDDYVEFSQSTVDEFGSLSKGTIAFWFKFESLLDTQTVMPIFYFGNDKAKTTQEDIYIIEIGHFDESSFDAVATPDPNNKKIYSTWMNNNRDPFLCFDSNKNLEEDKWHHYAVVVGADGNTGYLNGVELTNRRYNFGNKNDKSFLNSISAKERLILGYGRSSYLLSPEFIYFKGTLDDFRVYDKALSTDEVKELASLS